MCRNLLSRESRIGFGVTITAGLYSIAVGRTMLAAAIGVRVGRPAPCGPGLSFAGDGALQGPSFDTPDPIVSRNDADDRVPGENVLL
ncbi:MAG TPA: hypothetical protein PLI31_07155, partial [Methanoregulaceae archaeon]|nr:hypothetical protein [Methanoregulaceae archaeon]